MRVAIILSDGGAAEKEQRALTAARALRDAGHKATLILAQTTLQPSQPRCATAWQAEGFAWIPVSAGHLAPEQRRFPKDAWLVTAQAITGTVQRFDVAWFFDSEWSMPLLRERRFREVRLPFVALEAAAEVDIPDSIDAINRCFAQRYAAQWADAVLPTGYDAGESVAGITKQWEGRCVATPLAVRDASTSPAVTVCVAYYEEPLFLPELLLSLERQTTDDFTVVVVDDGSHSAEACAVFAACEAKYSSRGWKFVRQSNQYAGAAKNRAASEADTEFLLFIDSDDSAMPLMVERFLRAALLSGDDCLVAPNYAFQDDPNGPCQMLYDPPGNSLIASMGDDMHGGGCIFIRREAFAQLGGFTTLRGLSFDDYEFHVRANLNGLRWDVFPEFVYRYRNPRAAGVSRSTSAYANLARVRRWYQQRLQPAGLGQLPLAFASVYWKNEQSSAAAEDLQNTLHTRRAKRSPRGREMKLLLLTCNFPFAGNSGWDMRVQQMVRYFGSRYELTLMTAMPRELPAGSRKQTFQHLHALFGVEGSSQSAISDVEIPFRVREHYADTFQAALRSLPTDQYHAVLLDQIFMAEFRKDIDTLPVLTEHNIESRLLRQAAVREWSSSLPLHYQNAAVEAARLEAYESAAWREFPLRAVVSEADRREMDRRAPLGVTVVAPNGADPSRWLRDARFQSETVLFSGQLAYLPNIDAVEFLLQEIWPKVLQKRPQARLIVAGGAPSSAVRDAIDTAGGSVTLCANPASMDNVARRASVTVAPLRLGSGTRVKILESMAWGLPVVSTTLGVEGIDAEDGQHLLVRDGADTFAEAVVQLLSDAVLWQRLREAGGALVRERYAWDKVFAPLEDALIELIP
jgi:glycosyltransferase involved in cell wall biosynthesis